MKVHDIYIKQAADSENLKCEFKSLVKDANLRRRMSRLSKIGVHTALECLQYGTGCIDKIDAIITATGYGFLSNSENFLKDLIQNQEKFANPTSFIYSTFNTLGFQIAQLLNNHCYNTTHTHRECSFESALLDGIMQISSDKSKNVLVGAFEETTPTEIKILKRLGMSVSSMPAERATFFLLGNDPENALAEIKSLEFNVEWSKKDEWLDALNSKHNNYSHYCNRELYDQKLKQGRKNYYCPVYSAHTLWTVLKRSTKTGTNVIYTRDPGMNGTSIKIEVLRVNDH